MRAVELTAGKHGVSVERLGQAALPPGAVRAGEVRDPDVVAEAIRRLWSSMRFKTKKVAVGVANQRVVVRQVELPWLPESELRKSLSLQVADAIPMPIDEAILDFHLLEEFTTDAGARMVRILLVAAAREMINQTMTAVRKAGLTAVSVDITPFALLRSLVDVDTFAEQPGSEALVDVGATVTNIVVHERGVPKFVRILLMGGADITDAVADRLGIPLEQAEAIKHRIGIPPRPGVAAGSEPADRVVESQGAALVEQIRSSLDYYQTQAGAARIERIRLSGGGGQLEGLGERLSHAARLPVEPALVLSRFKLGKHGLTDDQLRYVEPMASMPVGLAMGAVAS